MNIPISLEQFSKSESTSEGSRSKGLKNIARLEVYCRIVYYGTQSTRSSSYNPYEVSESIGFEAGCVK